VAQDPVLIASQGGINLFIGNNPHADGLSAMLPQPFGHNWQIQDIAYVAEIKKGGELTPGEVSDYWSGRAREWMINNPVDFATLYLRKLYFSISDREVSNNRDLDAFFARVPFFRYHPLSFAILFALGAIGGVAGWRRDRRVGIITAALLLFIFSNSLFFVNSRFRLPEIPLLIMLSSFAVTWLFSQRRPFTRAGMVAILSAVALFLISCLPLLRLPFGGNVGGTASRANYLYVQGKYREAIEIGSQVLRSDSLFPDANLTVGAAYFRSGKGDSAKYYFERERTFHPARPKAYTNLASYYLVNHEYDSAYIKLNRALLLRPYDLMANSLLLRLVSADGEATSDDVLATISGTLARTDSNLTLLLEAAKVATERGLAPAAESLLHASLRHGPPPVETDDAAFEPSYPYTPNGLNQLRAEAHHLLGYLFGLSGRFAESIEESRAAIEREPGRAEAYVNLISGYVSIGDLVTANSELQIALHRFPDHPQIQQIAASLRQ
jgi:tetratricopeptide (TPR) repeat protein